MTMTTLLERFFATFTSSAPPVSRQLQKTDLVDFFNLLEDKMSRSSFVKYRTFTTNLVSALLHFRTTLNKAESWQVRSIAFTTATTQLYALLNDSKSFLFGALSILDRLKITLDKISSATTNTDIVTHSSPFDGVPDILQTLWENFASWVTNKTLSSLVITSFQTMFSERLSSDFPGSQVFSSFALELSHALSRELTSVSRGSLKTIPSILISLFHSASMWLKKQLGFETEETLELNTQYVHLNKICEIFTTDGVENMESKLSHLHPACPWVKDTFRSNDIEGVRNLIMSKTTSLITDITAVVNSRSDSDSFSVLASIATWKNILASLEQIRVQVRGAKADSSTTCGAITMIGAPGVGKTVTSESMQLAFMQGKDLATTGKINHSFKEYWSLIFTWAKNDVKYSAKHAAWCLTANEVGSTTDPKKPQTPAAEMSCPQSCYPLFIMENTGNGGNMRIDGAAIKDKGKYLHIGQIIGTCNSTDFWHHMNNPEALDRRNTTMLVAVNPLFSSRQNEVRVDHKVCHENRQEGSFGLCQLIYTSCFSPTVNSSNDKSGIWDPTNRQTSKVIHFPSRDPGNGKDVLASLYKGFLYTFVGDILTTSNHVETLLSDFSKPDRHSLSSGLLLMVNRAESRQKFSDTTDFPYTIFDALTAHSFLLVSSVATQSEIDSYRDARPDGLYNYPFGDTSDFPYTTCSDLQNYLLSSLNQSSTFLDAFSSYLAFLSSVDDATIFDMGPYAMVAFLISKDFREAVAKSRFEVYVKMNPSISLSQRDKCHPSPAQMWKNIKIFRDKSKNWPLAQYYFTQSYVCASMWKIHSYVNALDCSSQPRVDLHAKNTACSGYTLPTHLSSQMEFNESENKYFCRSCGVLCDEPKPFIPAHYVRSNEGNIVPVSYQSSHFDKMREKVASIKTRMTQHFSDLGGNADSPDLGPNLMEIDSKISRDYIKMYVHYITTQPGATMSVFLNFHPVESRYSRHSAVNSSTLSGRFFTVLSSWFFGEDYLPSAFRYDDSSWLTTGLFLSAASIRIFGGWKSALTSFAISFYTYGPLCFIPMLYRLFSFIFCLFILFTCPSGRVCFARWFNICSVVTTQCLATKVSSLSRLTRSGTSTKLSHRGTKEVLCEDVDFFTFNAYINQKCSAEFERVLEEVYTFESPTFSWRFFAAQFLSFKVSSAILLLFDNFFLRHIRSIWMPLSRYITRRVFASFLYSIAPPGLVANIYFASTQHPCFSDASDDMTTKANCSSDIYCSNMVAERPVSLGSPSSGVALPCSQIYRTRFLHLSAYNAKIDSAGAYSDLESRSSTNTASPSNAHFWVLYYMKFCTLTDPSVVAHLTDEIQASLSTVRTRTVDLQDLSSSLVGDYTVDSFTRNLAVNVSPEPGVITDTTTDYVMTSLTRILTNHKFYSERTLMGRMSRDSLRLDNSDYENNMVSCKLIMAHNEYFFHYSAHSKGFDSHHTHHVFSVPKFVGRVVPPGIAPEFTTYLMTGAGVFAFYKIIKYLTSIEQSTSEYHTCPTEVSHTVPPEKRESKYHLYIDHSTPGKIADNIKDRSSHVETITFTDIPKDAKSKWESTVTLEKGERHNIPTNMVNHSLTLQDTHAHVKKHTFKILVGLRGECQIATVNRIHTSPKAVVFLGNAHATTTSGTHVIPRDVRPTTSQEARDFVRDGKVAAYPLQVYSKKARTGSTPFRPYQLIRECSHVEIIHSSSGDAVVFIYYFNNTAAREAVMDSCYKEYMSLPHGVDPSTILRGKSLVMFVPSTTKHMDEENGVSHIGHPKVLAYVIHLVIIGTEDTSYGFSFTCECESRQQYKTLSKGDSGSPVFLQYGNRYVPFGIHSGVTNADDLNAIITPIFNGESDSCIDIAQLLQRSSLLAEKVYHSTVFDLDDRDYMLSRNLVTYSHVTTPPHGSIISPDDTSREYNHPSNELLNAVKHCSTVEHVGLVRAETFKASPVTKHIFKPFPTEVEFESAGIDRSTQYSELAKPLMSSILTSGYDYFKHFGPVQSTVYSLIRSRLSEDYLSLFNNPDLRDKLSRWECPTTMKLLSHNASSSAGSKLTMNDGSVLKRNKDFKNFTPEGAVLLTSAYEHMVDHVNGEAESGVAPAVFAQIFGKQEVRKKGKAMRGVNNESLFNRISVREALYPLEALYDTPNTKGEFGHAVGMDIATGLPRLIEAMGGLGAVGTACDYSEYDARVPPAIKDLALQTIWWLYRFAGLVSNDPVERAKQLNRFTAQTHSLRIPQTSANGVVFLCSPGVPSGHSATTTFNCLCNLILNYTFIVMSLSSDPKYEPAKEYLLRKGNWSRVVFFLCYGDDSVFALKNTPESREFVRLLTGGTDFGDAIRLIDLPAQADKLGMVLTDDKKRRRFEVNVIDFKQDPGDPKWSFCSRTIVTLPGIDGNPDVHLGVLLRPNISKCFFFLLQTADFKSFDDLSDTWVEQLCSKFESMLREVSFYGLLDYILFVKAFINFTRRITLPAYPSSQGFRVVCPGERRLVTAIDWKEFPSWKDILGCRFGDRIFYMGDNGKLSNRLKVSCKSNILFKATDDIAKYVDMTPADFLLEA